MIFSGEINLKGRFNHVSDSFLLHYIRSVCEFCHINLEGKRDVTIAIHQVLTFINMIFLIYSLYE